MEQKFYCGKQKFAYGNHIIVTYTQIDCLVIDVKQNWFCRSILNKLTLKYYPKHKWMNTSVFIHYGKFWCYLWSWSIFLFSEKKNLFSESFRNSFYKDHMHYAQSRQIKMGLLRPNMLSTRANLVAVLASTWQDILIAISISKQKNFACCNV